MNQLLNRYKCTDCQYLGKFQNGSTGCALTNQPVDVNKDFCSKHKKSAEPPITCVFCHQPIMDLKETLALDIGICCVNCKNRGVW